MQWYCNQCGEKLSKKGQCLNCNAGVGFQVKHLSGGEAVVSQPFPLASRPVSRDPMTPELVDFPKVSVFKRFLGSGIEFVIYLAAIVIITSLSIVTAGMAGVVFTLLACLIALRDLSSGAFSLSKRISQSRVVDYRTGLPVTNGQALARNSYYILLLIFMMIPFLGLLFGFLFLMLVFMDFTMIAISPNGRRLGDLIAKTQVVPEEKR